jgi:hypothetical protein
MILRDLFKNPKIRLAEGGNLELPNPNDPTQPYQAQEIQLAPTEINDEVHDRTYMVGVLKQLLDAINKEFAAKYKQPLWDQKLLDTNIKEFMAGSSEHFFDLERPNPNFNPKQPPSELNPKMVGISDEEFKKYKPKVGDIDIQCNQELQTQLEEFLTGANHARIGNATFLGFSRGSEQYNGLFQFDNPPIKLQLDFEYGRYAPETGKPAEWTKFSHSSSWEDIQQNIKGVFHKYIYRALAKAVPTEKYIAKLTGLGKNRKMAISGPVTDANFSFAVASKGGGGIRAKYKPYIDPETNSPKLIDGLPVMEPLKSEDSEYIQDLNKQFQLFFGEPPTGDDRTLQNSFVGTLELMNRYLDDSAKRKATVDFLSILFEPGGQMITKNDPARDYDIKFAAVNKMLSTLGLEDMQADAEAQSQAYIKDFQDVEAYKKANPGEKQPRAAMLRSRNAAPVTEAEETGPQVKAQLRKGMPHLRDLKPTDLLDLLDEIHDGNGNFKLQNIPLNVKVDGFGGRFGKNADGKPFMGTSRTEPRYQAGFVDYHQKKGTTDPEILGRAQLFDDLFNEMMKAVKLVDSKLGQDFLINKQVTCEVLYIPFATETDEGKLKFVGIHYDKLPEGVQLALVPFRVVDATTGEDLPDAQDVVKQLTSVGQAGSVMFIDNSLTQNEALDVTALVPPVENIEQLKAMLASKKRDQAAEVKAALQPVALALEKAIIEDPNIIGKDLLGQDYEGIVINSRLGPIKVTSQEQRDVISAKNAAKAQVKASQAAAGDIPQTGNKTAVVAIGSFVGHIGHEQLFDYTVKKAQEVGGDPYLFIGSAVGKDDPIPPNVKVQTWHKLYPEYASHISAVTQEGGTLMQKIKHELIQPRPGGQPRYDNIIIMVGEDREGMPIANALMKSVNKFAGYEHVKVSLEATPRGTGMSFSKLRNILKDPNATEEQQYALWSQAFDVNKLGINWIKHLMDVTRKGMGIQQPQAPAPQQPEPVAEQRLFNALVRPLKESTSIESTLKAIINDIGEPVTNVYDTMKYQAKKYVDNHGELGRGFRMVAAGVGGRWVQGMYIGKLQNELYDLCKYNTRRTVDLQDFLRGVEANGELDSKRSFGNIANELPEILAKIGQHLNAPQLTKNAQRWIQNKAAYEQYLEKLEAEVDGDDYDEPAQVKPPKSNIAGQQNAQADQIVNNVLKKLPTKIQGDIRNAISRSPNKLQALHAELLKRGVKMPMAEERMSAAVKLQRAWERERAKSDASLRRTPSSIPKPEPKKDEKVAEKMMPASNFAGTPKNKLGSAGQLKGSMKRPARAGDLVGGAEESIEHEHIVKVKGGYELKSKHGNKNLGKYPTKAGAEKRERQVQYFKHAGEEIETEGKKKGADGKACWDGYRYNGTSNGKDKCVKVSENVENIMDSLINKIIVNEAIQNNKR